MVDGKKPNIQRVTTAFVIEKSFFLYPWPVLPRYMLRSLPLLFRNLETLYSFRPAL